MTARVRILFIDGCGKHSNGADKQLAVLFGRFFQPLDVLLDIASHFVEVFSQLADFRSPADGRTLVEFAAADRASGRCQTANRPADTHREEIPHENRGQDNHADERERLPVQLGYAGVALRLIEPPLGNDRPIQFRNRAIRPDHFDFVFFDHFRVTNRFCVAKFLRQRLHLRHQGIAAHIGARDKIFRVLVRHQAAVVVHQKNRAFPHAGFLQMVQDGFQGDYCSQHAGEILVDVFQGHGHHKAWPVSRCQR